MVYRGGDETRSSPVGAPSSEIPRQLEQLGCTHGSDSDGWLATMVLLGDMLRMLCKPPVSHVASAVMIIPTDSFLIAPGRSLEISREG